jgi:adenosine deaminase
MLEDGEARRGEDGLTELHCHLDGSLRPSTFIELYQQVQQAGGTAAGGFPLTTELEIHENLCFQEGWDLPRCLQSFATTLAVLQTAANITRVAYETCQDLASDGVGKRACPAAILPRPPS